MKHLFDAFILAYGVLLLHFKNDCEGKIILRDNGDRSISSLKIITSYPY